MSDLLMTRTWSSGLTSDLIVQEEIFPVSYAQTFYDDLKRNHVAVYMARRVSDDKVGSSS